MHTSGSRARLIWVSLALLAGPLAAAPAADLHIRLEESSPARDEVLTASPAQLRLLFSGPIEARYTSVTLTAPDGAPVDIGDVVFIEGSDREVTTLLPALVRPGSYTVNWRTAGADGHVLEGSWSFLLRIVDTTTALDPDTSERTADALPGSAGDSAASGQHADHEEPESVGGVRDAIGRGLHFAALLLLLGSVAFRVLLMPRLALPDVTYAVLQRRTWRLLSAAALLLGASAVLRMWFQSTALHGADRAWSTPLLSIMLTDTGWGRAWVLQAFLFALLGMAIVWARPRHPPRSDRAAVIVAVPAVLGLAVIPGLSGHAAGAIGIGRLALVNDAIHVAAAGAWLGTLALLMLVAVPAIRLLESDGDAAAADAVDRFSPIALTCAVIVLLSGVASVIIHLSAPAQLWTTGYGRTLLVKLLLVAGVASMGFVNWRVVRPRLRRGVDRRRLQVTAAAELVFALSVVIVTAVLTGQPRP